VIDVASSVGKHEIVEENVLVGEKSKRFGDGYIPFFAGGPIAPLNFPVKSRPIAD
jgi:hypothetical protein